MNPRFVKFEDKIFKLESTPDGGAASFMRTPDGGWKPVSIGVFTEGEMYGETLETPNLTLPIAPGPKDSKDL